MVQRILSGPQEELLAEDRRLLGELQTALARFDAAAEDQKTLAASIQRLDELFLLVVAGEFNAGKSAFINALLGQQLLEEGVTPTTTHIHLLKHGEAVVRSIALGGIEVVAAPLPLLREINIVDTPGTNAIERHHEAITREFVPNSDLVLFVTSADRPFTESERAFLEQIREWGKKIVVVVNKIDILRGEEEVRRIEAFITENATRLLGFAPAIFPLSARQALAAKQRAHQAGSEQESAGAADLLRHSRFAALERFVVDTLDEGERVRLKLASPLGVGQRLGKRYLEVAEGRLDVLKHDFTALEDIEGQLAVYREDMAREFRFRLSDVEKVLTELEGRGIAFFDELLRLGRIVDLVNKARVRADFEREVVADLPQKIEARVGEVIDWMVASELRQWQAVTDHLRRRQSEVADRIVGRAGGGFDYDRARLLEKVGGAARRTVDSFDRSEESARLAESVQTAVAGAALLEVGAVGLGTAITLIATSTAADITGIVAAGAVAVLGLFIIPARRRRAKSELRTKIAGLKERLMGALTEQFDDEIAGSVRRILEAIAPYTRFVRAERQRLTASRDELAAVESGLEALRQRLERLAPA
jgi:small GTP-binding protein